MKIFGGEMVKRVYDSLTTIDNIPIELKIISKTVETAQKRVEGKYFSIRKHVLQYDDVMNKQREIIYGQRKQVLNGESVKENILNMINSVAESVVQSYTLGIENLEDINQESMKNEITMIFGLENLESLCTKKIDEKKIIEELKAKALQKYEAKEQEFGEERLRELERVVLLRVVDQKWMNHIDNMEDLKEGIGLRAYGQKDPVVQYKIEGFDMFDQMITDVKIDVVKFLMNIKKSNKEIKRNQNIKITGAKLENNADAEAKNTKETQVKTVVNTTPKVRKK